MPRIRSIKPEFFDSDTTCKLSFREMLTFAGLWVYCDDHGRGRDNAHLVKGVVWPQRPDVGEKEVANDLTRLNMLGFIVRYEKNGSKYLAIPSWRKHQRVNHPTKSKYPPPPRLSRESQENLFNPQEALYPEVEVGSGSGSGTGKGNREQGNGFSPPTALRENSEPEPFDRFWAAYPKHVAKQEARRAFAKRVKSGTDPESLIGGARRFADWVTSGGVDSPKFVPYPATWLNAGQETDELADPVKQNGRPKGVAAIDAVYAEARRQMQ